MKGLLIPNLLYPVALSFNLLLSLIVEINLNSYFVQAWYSFARYLLLQTHREDELFLKENVPYLAMNSLSLLKLLNNSLIST